jgi:TatD DNase family protein
MSVMLVDSHCHLDFPEFAPELDAVVQRARDAGVRACVSIGTTLERFPAVRAIAERFTDVWCSVGIHPHEAEKEPLGDAAPLIERTRHPRVVGIGETGLDFYYNHSPRAPQIANFRAHIAAARETGLPLIVHARDADDDTISVLRDEMGKGAFTGLIHCFTGTKRLAEAALDIGFCISVSGIVTFKKSGELRAVLKDVPLERLLVETDAPYLAPMPHRGKRNEPAFVVNTAVMLADLKGVSAVDLAHATTENFFRLFAKASRPDG